MTPASLKRANTNDGSVSPPPSKRAVTSTVKQTSTTTQKVVANFFTKTSEKSKVPEKLSWRTIQSSLIVGDYLATEAKKHRASLRGKIKVAAFDFDSTLISTASGNRFAKDANDWCWWHGSVPARLKKLSEEEGYIVIIISNQSGISLKPSTAKNAPKIVKNDRYTQFKQKATAVFNALNLPISIYAASEKDLFRKPATGIWKEFLSDYEILPEDIDHNESIFVGDAGGRVAGTYNGKLVKADFSCSDRNFAANVGIKYTTPEQFFLGEEERPYERLFDPTIYTAIEGTSESFDDCIPAIPFSPSPTQEILVFVGFPGSGKSTFYQTHLAPHNYTRINQDTLKSKDRCIKVANESLRQGHSLAIDNTNPDRAVRDTWISLAKKYNVPVRCVWFTASKELAIHNNIVRAIAGVKSLNPDAREVLPQLAFNSFGARFQEPTIAEGFGEVIKLEFKFAGSEEERAVWSKYWF